MRSLRTAFLLAAICTLNCSCHLTRHAAPSSALNVMTFNIRYNNPDDGENAWPQRRDLVAKTIRFYQVDLLGVQEALHEQMQDLSESLPEFKWIGAGRDDGKEKGEYSAIFYRPDRFKLLQQQTFWLSATPERAGSVGWDAAITRVCTWGQFRDQPTGKAFFIFNTHFDHIGETARRESAKLVLENIRRQAAAAPAILTGDFNATDTSAVYQILSEGALAPAAPSHLLYDTRHISLLPHYGPLWTFHGFGKVAARPGIDYVFVTSGVKVLRHGTIAEGERYASDHLPVLAELRFE